MKKGGVAIVEDQRMPTAFQLALECCSVSVVEGNTRVLSEKVFQEIYVYKMLQYTMNTVLEFEVKGLPRDNTGFIIIYVYVEYIHNIARLRV